MTAKKIAKLFIPPVVLKIKKRMFPPAIKKCKILSTIATHQKKSSTLFVLGNGPSLNKSMEMFSSTIAKNDSIAVNLFCTTKYFTLVKPKFYVIADPLGQTESSIDTFHPAYKQKFNAMMDGFQKSLNWHMTLVLPDFGYNGYIYNQLSHNPFIHILFYNTKNCLGVKNKDNPFFGWDTNLCAPPAQTVVNTAVYLGIFWRYNDVYLMGADTSWTEDIHIDQNDNTLYEDDTHFYGTKKNCIVCEDAELKKPLKLHEVLSCITRALEFYCKLNEYANHAGVHVYNASEYSLIDAFPRKKPSIN